MQPTLAMKLTGKNLKRLRERAGLTQLELAMRVHVDPQTISNSESRVFVSNRHGLADNLLAVLKQTEDKK